MLPRVELAFAGFNHDGVAAAGGHKVGQCQAADSRGCDSMTC